jgi:NADPH2 dehydrogenase
MTKLFSPVKVGRLNLPFRISMAPMTRFRADDDHVPLPFVKEYYSQRSVVPGSLLITEATFITEKAGGYPSVPGIYSKNQIAAWKEVTDTVHSNGSYIFMQLWALGRTSRPEILEASGYDLQSASNIPINKDAPVPRPLSEDEIQSYIADYAQAARNAIAAGFDGVEIHGANGYLVDQFIQDVSNDRKDAWGGSVEKRARFALEVTKAIVDAIGADRAAIRLSPFSTFQGMRMADPVPQYTYLAQELAKFKLAYVHVTESMVHNSATIIESDKLDFFLDTYADASPVVVCGCYESASAKEAVDVRYKDHNVIIAFGRPYLANPDLPFRILEGIALATPVKSTIYKPRTTDGYTDYPFSEQFARQLKI